MPISIKTPPALALLCICLHMYNSNKVTKKVRKCGRLLWGRKSIAGSSEAKFMKKQLRGYDGKQSGVQADQMYGEAMRKYGNLSEDALVSKLVEMVHKQKQEGTFDEVQLLGFINTITPHLNAQQRSRLEGVLGMIGE